VTRSRVFQDFLDGVASPVTLSRDSMDEIPNIAAFHLLDGDERLEAEDILIARLATGDGRAATALADGYCLRAIPALIEATTDAAAPVMRVFAARALLRMDSDAGRESLARMLRDHEGSDFDRGSAARLLAEFPDPDVDLLLEVASTDPDGLVRSQATTALFEVVGLEDHHSGEVLLSVAGRLLSSLTTVRAEALAELRAVLAAWKAGATAEDLGLTWQADREHKPLGRLIDDIDSTRTDFRLDGLRELTGRERILVDNLVLLRLHADRRAVRAAGRLGVRRAIEPLRELLGSAKGHAREEILSVLDSLTALGSAGSEEFAGSRLWTGP
jgi:HEAT repeat protein